MCIYKWESYVQTFTPKLSQNLYYLVKNFTETNNLDWLNEHENMLWAQKGSCFLCKTGSKLGKKKKKTDRVGHPVKKVKYTFIKFHFYFL